MGRSVSGSVVMVTKTAAEAYGFSKCVHFRNLLFSAITAVSKLTYRARQLYKNISMLFLFPVKDGKLNTGVNATFDSSCYG